jgi:hypothetical protein
MKGILEFNLPEDHEDFMYAQNGILYSIVIDELDNWLRSKVKYEDKSTLKISEVREKLNELLQERGLL